MIAVLFEVRPKPQARLTYLDIARELAEDLTQIEGFVSVERFESLSTPGKLLSLSFWTDEGAVTRWRRHAEHRQAQERGKRELFAAYSIHVASIVRSYGSKSEAAV